MLKLLKMAKALSMVDSPLMAFGMCFKGGEYREAVSELFDSVSASNLELSDGDKEVLGSYKSEKINCLTESAKLGVAIGKALKFYINNAEENCQTTTNQECAYYNTVGIMNMVRVEAMLDSKTMRSQACHNKDYTSSVTAFIKSVVAKKNKLAELQNSEDQGIKSKVEGLEYKPLPEEERQTLDIFVNNSKVCPELYKLKQALGHTKDNYENLLGCLDGISMGVCEGDSCHL